MNQFKEKYSWILATALGSTARICIIPVQEWLGLDNSARMNVPGTVDVNWSWRVQPGQLTEDMAAEMLTLTKRYGRANWETLNKGEEA